MWGVNEWLRVDECSIEFKSNPYSLPAITGHEMAALGRWRQQGKQPATLPHCVNNPGCVLSDRHSLTNCASYMGLAVFLYDTLT